MSIINSCSSKGYVISGIDTSLIVRTLAHGLVIIHNYIESKLTYIKPFFSKSMINLQITNKTKLDKSNKSLMV